MFKRTFVMTAATLCAATGIAIGTFAPAAVGEGRGGHSERSHDGRSVEFIDLSPITAAEFDAAYPADTSRCTFDATGNVVSPCVAPITPTAPPGKNYDDTLTGDFTGTGNFARSAVLSTFNDLSNPAALDIAYEAYTPYSLHVDGCGTGTLVLRSEGNLNSPDGVWQIVPGSGRGELLGISGGGTFSAGEINPDGTTPENYEGNVSCGHHHK